MKFQVRYLALFLLFSVIGGWQQFLGVDLFPIFLNTGTTDETFQQYGKQVCFRHILKNSASIYESSGSQFLRITTGIQSGPDAFDESRFIMTFLTIMGGRKYYAVSDQLQKGKQVKRYQSLVYRLEFLESFQQVILLYQMQKTTRLVH